MSIILQMKNLMLAFESETVEETVAGNHAIKKVLDGMKFRPFHQIGTSIGGNNRPGFHAWEVWAKVTPEFLEALIPYVNEEAATFLETSY